MSKVFGYPEYDEKGEKILTTYDNEYKAMMMDRRTMVRSRMHRNRDHSCGKCRVTDPCSVHKE